MMTAKALHALPGQLLVNTGHTGGLCYALLTGAYHVLAATEAGLYRRNTLHWHDSSGQLHSGRATAAGITQKDLPPKNDTQGYRSGYGEGC
jgi:hypothetical protein